jgi:hypothetical protein
MSPYIGNLHNCTVTRLNEQNIFYCMLILVDSKFLGVQVFLAKSYHFLLTKSVNKVLVYLCVKWKGDL